MADPATPVFARDVRMSTMSEGGGLALLSFRACAIGATRCCCLPHTINHHFGAAGPGVLRHIMVMVQIIGHSGARTVSLSYPKSDRVTCDEASLLAALHAAQH